MNALIASLYLLVGTYTSGGSRGIYIYEFNPTTAQTEYIGVAEIPNPSYMTAHGNMVYAVSENGDGTDAVSALRFEAGRLEMVNSMPTGGSPCNVAANGALVATANYTGGDISVFGVREDGGLTTLKQRLSLSDSSKSHMHCVKFSPDGKYLFASDLGTDAILRCNVQDGTLDASSMKTFEVAAGSGPRHFIFSKDGASLFLITEVSGQVMAFDYNGGELSQRQTIDVDPAHAHGSADIVLSGRHLYASNRLKNDGVAILSVGRKLHAQGYRTTGTHPRNLCLSPDGRFLLVSCRDSNAVQIFAVDSSTGVLTPTRRSVNVNTPVCAMFMEP